MFYFGVDYYPEQWPETRWPEDARLMAAAHFNIVRLAEFAWAKLEPAAGRFELTWLDRAMQILADRGLRIVLGTPTASPPAWLMSKHPEIFRVGEDGQRLTFGHRRQYCPNNPRYREYAARIVACLAERYAAHPAVIGWQIDNELGGRCYCEACTSAFQNWLCRKYDDLEALNSRWGTVFWSHSYSRWDEIPVPLSTGGVPNPGLALDFCRFASDSYVSFQQEQAALLRGSCPGHFVTHNLMGFGYDQVDYYDLAGGLDFVAWDNYPRTQWSMRAEVDPSQAALAADTMRGLKRRNVWVMEQQAGQGGWDVVSVAPRPGELRLWGYQAIAHGADAVLFFRWRTARFGAEQYWHGLLDHDSLPSRRYAEVKRMGAEIQTVGPLIAGSVTRAPVALLLSYPSRFAFQIQANNPRFSYGGHFQDVYRAIHRLKVTADVISPGADLTGYRLVVAPALHVLSEVEAENLRSFVAGGGLLIITPRSGVKDEANAVVELPLPGLLAELCGVRVAEYDSLPVGEDQPLEFALPNRSADHEARAAVWCDILEPVSADVVARYTRGYYAGRPAMTLNRFGRGQAIYVGTIGDDCLWSLLAGWAIKLAGVRPHLDAPDGVEVTERWQADRRLLFVLNHTERAQSVRLDGRYIDRLDPGATREGEFTLAPYDVAVLEAQRE